VINRAVATIFHGGIPDFDFSVRRAAWQENGLSNTFLTFLGQSPRKFLKPQDDLRPGTNLTIKEDK
jgi:hypothetical protein